MNAASCSGMSSLVRSSLGSLGLVGVAVVAAAACQTASPPAGERPTVAMVAGEPIFAEDFKRELKRLRLEDSEGEQVVGSDMAQRRALLDDLIDRRLLLREAESKNVVVSADEVNAELLRGRSGWTDDDLHDWLADRGLTEVDLTREARELLSIRKYLVEHVFARVAVTDQEIESYIIEHPESSTSAERVRARHIVVKTEEKAQEVLRALRSGTRFEDAAMQFSMSPEGKNGGDLGFFARGSMPKVFDEVCFVLQPGELSKVVASDYGFHLFEVMEKRPAEARPIEEVRTEVEKVLRRHKEAQAQRVKIEELRAAARVRIEEGLLAQIN